MKQQIDVSGAIRQRRERLNLSRSKFGRLVNAEQNTVMAWEFGTAKPSWEALALLVQEAGIEPATLLGTPACDTTNDAGSAA